MSGALTALAGTALGGMVALGVELVKGRNDERADRRNALLRSCSDFTAHLTRIRSLCYNLDGPGNRARVQTAIEDARVECERLRLLLESKQTQEAARMAVRHIYAVWSLADKGADPRADEYPGTSPSSRLRESLTAVYIGVRRETGSRHPEQVFVELPD